MLPPDFNEKEAKSVYCRMISFLKNTAFSLVIGCASIFPSYAEAQNADKEVPVKNIESIVDGSIIFRLNPCFEPYTVLEKNEGELEVVTDNDGIKIRQEFPYDNLLRDSELEGVVNLQKMYSPEIDGKKSKKLEDRKYPIQQIKLNTDRKKTLELIEKLRATNLFEFVVPDYIAEGAYIPSDASFGEQWGLHNDGSFGRLIDNDIDMAEAYDIMRPFWAIFSGRNLVSLIGEPVDVTNLDLDHGIIDANNSWNFVTGNNDVTTIMPGVTDFHETEIAGILLSEIDNPEGEVAGALNGKMSVAVVTFDSTFAPHSKIIEALDWLSSNPEASKVISYSYVSRGNDYSLYSAFVDAGARGSLIVASSGNNGVDLDASGTYSYPTSWRLPNMISVASIRSDGEMSIFSEYGAQSVNVGAPGEDIYTTTGGGASWNYVHGTSFASPYVASIASMAKIRRDSLRNVEMKALIENRSNGKSVPGVIGRTTSERMPSAFLVLEDLLNYYIPCGAADVSRRRRLPDIIDSLVIAQKSAGLPVLIDNMAGDVNRTGNIDVIDALIVARYSAGLPSQLNCY